MAIDLPFPSETARGAGDRRMAAWARQAGPPLATAIAYVVAAEVGAWLAFPAAPVSAFWAPNAILLAALLLAPRERWWIYLLVLLPFHFGVQLADMPPARAAIQYAVNCAEAGLGAWALLQLAPHPRRFDRLRTVVVLILFAGFLAPLVTSLAMVAGFRLAGIPADFWLTVTARTITNTFAVVALVPLVVHMVTALRAGAKPVAAWRIIEAAALAGALAAVSTLVFAIPESSSHPSVAWLFAPLPVLAWATIRFRVPGACSAALLVGAVSTWGVLNGHGPFDVQNPIENALSLVAFHVMICVTFVLCAALIEEWRHAARALRASEARFRGMVEQSMHAAVLGSVHDQIAVLDGAGSLIEVNESWRRSVQLAHPWRFDRVLEGDSYLAACARATDTGDHAAIEHLTALQSVLDGRETRCQFDYQEPAGMEPAWIEVSIEKLRRPGGGAVVTRTDITARKRAEQEARDQQQQLAHLGRAAVLGQLSGAFAHELNQPLTSILGNAEAALKLLDGGNGNPAELREILRDIVHDDVRAAQVIDRLRALLERGDALRRPVDLNATIRDVLDLARGELLTRHVTVTLSLDNTAPIVMADRVQVQQIVLNLLMNACDAMGNLPVADRKVAIATRFLPQASRIEATMTDNGCGIAAADLERIFQPFVTTKAGGMGMGLAICRSVAESHGGRLRAENVPGGGAAFRLELPVGGSLS